MSRCRGRLENKRALYRRQLWLLIMATSHLEVECNGADNVGRTATDQRRLEHPTQRRRDRRISQQWMAPDCPRAYDFALLVNGDLHRDRSRQASSSGTVRVERVYSPHRFASENAARFSDYGRPVRKDLTPFRLCVFRRPAGNHYRRFAARVTRHAIPVRLATLQQADNGLIARKSPARGPISVKPTHNSESRTRLEQLTSSGLDNSL